MGYDFRGMFLLRLRCTDYGWGNGVIGKGGLVVL